MKKVDMIMVRVYLTEEEAHLQSLLKHLREQGKLRGVTVFRGIAGIGQSGTMHTASLVDLSLDLPLVIEFFDTPARAEAMIEYLLGVVGPGHIVSWPVSLASDDDA